MKTLALLLGLLVLAGLAWVRLAPSDPARWHQRADVEGAGDISGANSHVWREVTERGAERLATLDRIIRATPRTRVLAGSLAERKITYVTRSRLMGYPDYTTLSLAPSEGGEVLELYSRARFGKSDLGVNRARIRRWLALADGSGAGTN